MVDWEAGGERRVGEGLTHHFDLAVSQFGLRVERERKGQADGRRIFFFFIRYVCTRW